MRARSSVRRAHEQHREARVEHVARRHAAVQPARLGPGELLDVREERDHVVLHRRLDLVDARRIERARPSPAGSAP
jgi:hypothetical protein